MTTKIKVKVNPVDVLDAYEKTGIEPGLSNWNFCALGVLARANGVQGRGNKSMWALTKFGEDFTNGFTYGFDGGEVQGWRTSSYEEGHANGVLVRAAVFGGEG